jgi:hypothetical protein
MGGVQALYLIGVCRTLNLYEGRVDGDHVDLKTNRRIDPSMPGQAP